MIREQLTRLGGALLALGRSLDQAAGRARHRDLEGKLATAYAEIERLRARLDEATREPTLFEQVRTDERAMRQRRLRIARGADRRYEGSDGGTQRAY